MPQTRGAEAQAKILSAALTLIKERGIQRVTVDQVARQAECAKGLVHYHFKTKVGLFDAVARELVTARIAKWRQAFDAPTPSDAIGQTWRVLTAESASGIVRAWTTMLAPGSGVPDQKVSDGIRRFSEGLAGGVAGLMGRVGLEPSIDPGEIGWLLGAVIEGMGRQLASGADEAALEGAYAAAWLGILSLFRSPSE